jgi:UrcA family protein
MTYLLDSRIACDALYVFGSKAKLGSGRSGMPVATTISEIGRTLMSSRALSKVMNAALVGAACALVCGMSQATPLDPNVEKVSANGLDLGSDLGAHKMFTRLTIASERVCGGTEAEFDALRTFQYRACYRETLSKAVRMLNQPMVTHAYIAQYPKEAAHFGIAEGGSYVAGR